MGSETLAKIGEFMNGLIRLLTGLSGIGFWLFVAGFILLIFLGLVVLGRLFYAVIRTIPNMTVGQFVKFIVVLAVVLIVVGIFLP
ncbi:MAG: hypothetical protein QXE81_05660 [Desulfurococcaceae archaeon]